MYKCVFFDLFGTLADDDKGYDKFLVGLIDNKEKRKKFIDLWCIKRREWYKYKYSPFEDILERSFNEALKQMEIYINKANCDFLEIFQNMPQFKEIENVLLKLKNRHKIGILTNSNNDFLSCVLNNLQVKFDYIISAESIKVYKPHPASYLAMLQKSKLKKEDIMFVSCSGWDIDGAKKVGIANVFIDRKKGETLNKVLACL